MIVESPRHLTTTTELSTAELTDVLAVYRQRLASLAAIERVRYGLVFKNVGLPPARRWSTCTVSSSACRSCRRPWSRN